MSEKLKRTLKDIGKICPDYTVAIKHGDFRRADMILHLKQIEIQQKIRTATRDLNGQLDTIDKIYYGEWDSLAFKLRMRVLCGWNPSADERAAMKTLGIELESEAGNGS